MFLKNRILHCIGDSHASFFSGYDKIQPIYPDPSENRYLNIISYRLGPVLAYNLTNTNSTSRGREKLLDILKTKVKPDDYILLSFGEIDCRYHIIKNSIKLNISVEEGVLRCVNRYLKVIKEVMSFGSKVIVFGPIASAADGGTINPNFPRSGTCQERNIVTQLFNEILINRSNEIGFLFISLFTNLVDENLKTKTEYYMDEAHLSQQMFPSFLDKISELILGFKPIVKSRINKLLYE